MAEGKNNKGGRIASELNTQIRAEPVLRPALASNIVAKPNDDRQREFSLELALSEAETRLRLEPHSLQNKEFAKATLIALRNFMGKYSKMKEEVPIVSNAIDAIDLEPLECIKSLNRYMFNRFHSIYGFGLLDRKQKDWKLNVLERLQIEDKLAYNDPIFQSKMLNQKPNPLLKQDAYIDNWYVTEADNDLLELFGGVRGMGKSTTALWKLIYTMEFRGESPTIKNIRQWFKYNIIYTDEESLGKKILDLNDDVLIVDEGYFAVYNLKSMEREVIRIAQNMNATRNRHNIYYICMSDLSAATKPIQRLATGFYWIQRIGHINKYVKTKNWVNSKDPLGLDEINAAKYDFSIDRLLLHHKFYITRMRVAPLSERWYKIYNDIKGERQNEKNERDERKLLNERLDERLIEKAMTSYNTGDKDVMAYFAARGFPKSIARAYTRKVMERIWRDRELKSEDETTL